MVVVGDSSAMAMVTLLAPLSQSPPPRHLLPPPTGHPMPPHRWALLLPVPLLPVPLRGVPRARWTPPSSLPSALPLGSKRMTERRTAWATAGRPSRKSCETCHRPHALMFQQMRLPSRLEHLCRCRPRLGGRRSGVSNRSVSSSAILTSIPLISATGDSTADQLTRLQTCIVTLQNFKGGAGSGVGCPAVSTTWKELQAQLQSEAK